MFCFVILRNVCNKVLKKKKKKKYVKGVPIINKSYTKEVKKNK